MAFLETPRFPERIAIGAVGGPEFATTVVATAGGEESRQTAWAYPLHKWDVSQGVNTPADFTTLRNFFMAVRGRLHGWRFKDFTDYSATVSEGKVTAITSTTFQMVKRYTSGALTMDRIIKKPVSGTVAAFVSGSPATFTVDTTTGILTIAAAPAAADVTWSGEFDIPMRFDIDRMQARIEARNPSRGLLQTWESIPIVELRRP